VNVVALVPRRADGGRRDLVWRWVRARWERDHPDWPVYEGHHNDGPFNRSAAINRAAEAAGEWDVAVIIDADTFTPQAQVRRAVGVCSRRQRIGFAYHEYRYLDRAMSDLIMGGYEGDWHPGVEFTLTNSCSSCVVVPHRLWEQVGGFDEGFEGWGFEDVAFSLACQALGRGMDRTRGDVWHLHHRPSPENSHRSPEWQANRARHLLYGDCDYDADKMRALLVELGVTK
jgi:hypothetical protein